MGLVTDIGRKLAKRRAAALVLPGLVFTALAATGLSLGQRHWADLELLRHLLVGPDATRAAVCGALPGAAVVHFACHAGSDPEDTAASRLLLVDGDLRVGEIAELHPESAEPAYPSACGTARASASPAFVDEVIHLASVFQVAGYTQSVATLWEVGDAFAAEAAAAFHRAPAPALPDPAPLPAVLALHHTVRALRAAGPDHPWTWAALVHAGA